MSYVSAGQDHIGSYVVKDVCIHSLENICNWKLVTCNPLLCGVVITAIWAVLVIICNLEF